MDRIGIAGNQIRLMVLGAVVLRKALIRSKGKEWFEKSFLPGFQPLAVAEPYPTEMSCGIEYQHVRNSRGVE